MRRCFIILYGPTAVGKTEFAESFAAQAGCEIVNADLGQFYTPLSIGTAKPQWQKSTISQHLFDILNEPQNFSVAHYRDRALTLFEEIWSRGSLPLVVGGSGFYIKSLLYPPIGGSIPLSTTSAIPQKADWRHLYEIDPMRALNINPHDSYRVQRALAIFYATGKKPSEYVPQYQPLGSFCYVYLTRDRHELYQRIEERTELMLTSGWLKEVERLQDTAWEQFLKKKKLIGYDDILNYLEGDKRESDWHELISVIKIKTRHYAKRQMTLGNQLYEQLAKITFETADQRSSCMQFNLTATHQELYINQLLEKVTLMKNLENDGHDHD